MNPGNLILAALLDMRAWTWRRWLGVILVVAAYYLPRLVVVSAGIDDLLDLAAFVGGGLLAFTGLGTSPASAGPAPRGNARGAVLAAFLVLSLAVLGAWLLATVAGCAALERREVSCSTAPEVVLEDLPDGRCALRGYCDGHELWTALGPGPCGEVEER